MSELLKTQEESEAMEEFQQLVKRGGKRNPFIFVIYLHELINALSHIQSQEKIAPADTLLLVIIKLFLFVSDCLNIYRIVHSALKIYRMILIFFHQVKHK